MDGAAVEALEYLTSLEAADVAPEASEEIRCQLKRLYDHRKSRPLSHEPWTSD